MHKIYFHRLIWYIYDRYGNMSVYEVNSNNEIILNNSDSLIGNINPYRYKIIIMTMNLNYSI